MLTSLGKVGCTKHHIPEGADFVLDLDMAITVPHSGGAVLTGLSPRWHFELANIPSLNGASRYLTNFLTSP